LANIACFLSTLFSSGPGLHGGRPSCYEVADCALWKLSSMLFTTAYTFWLLYTLLPRLNDSFLSNVFFCIWWIESKNFGGFFFFLNSLGDSGAACGSLSGFSISVILAEFED
jgi:hypothetical protein